MESYVIAGLKELGIKPKPWGAYFRVKTVNEHGCVVYTSKISSPAAKECFAKYHKQKVSDVVQAFNPNRGKMIHKPHIGKAHESYDYQHVSQYFFYNKTKEILTEKCKAGRSFKVNVFLGYDLINKLTGEERYFHATSETRVFSYPIAINRVSDIQTKIIDFIKGPLQVENLRKYKDCSWVCKGISAFNLLIYYREHKLGEIIELPPILKKMTHNSNYVTNFQNTGNKCVLYCVGYHIAETKPLPKRMVETVKDALKRWCAYKNVSYSTKLYNEFKPIDVMEFDSIEDCFNININMYEMNSETYDVSKLRMSEKSYKSTMSILDYSGHAMLIVNLDAVLSKYYCNTCEMYFDTCKRLLNHKRTKCGIKTIERFDAEPKNYRPFGNKMKHLLQKYKIKNTDFYQEHFICYDFESILKPIEEKHGENTIFTSQHTPISVSICDSLTREVMTFIEDCPKTLLLKMFNYMDNVREKIHQYNFNKYESLIIEVLLREKVGDATNREELIKLLGGKTLYEHYGALACEFSDKSCYARDMNDIVKFMSRALVLGFNTGKYDLNVIKNDLFDVLGVDKIDNVIKNSGYMCISANRFKMLDICNYVPAGTSYGDGDDSYLSTYLGKCKCENKITCTCGMGKGLFPYEHIASSERLSETQLPPKEAFYSSLKKKGISDEDYDRMIFVWSHYEMNTLKDLLKWYNELDVKPFVDAVIKHREPFKKFQLDIFMDGVSLPSIAEKVMYQTCYSNIKFKRQNGGSFDFPSDRFNGYKSQDTKADREFSLTLDHVNYLLNKSGFCCHYCSIALTDENASCDRINNKKGHVDDNIVMSCRECNIARKDMSMDVFRQMKLIEQNEDRLIFTIDEANKEIYHTLKKSIVGGPSIIFKRYAKAGETYIRNGEKLCQSIVGFDCNALYLYAIGQKMPCGKLTSIESYDGMVDDIRSGKLFGFLECDIKTPDHLKDHFAEMPPIFKNIIIDPSKRELIGDYMFQYNESRGDMKSKKSRKLISSYFGERQVIYVPLPIWYLDHGLEITKMYSFIKAKSNTPFKAFMDKVSDARRDGDSDKSKSMIANMMKFVGNSAFGKSCEDKTKHKNIKYASTTNNVMRVIEKPNCIDLTELNGAFEVSLGKRSIKLNNPIHVACAIFNMLSWLCLNSNMISLTNTLTVLIMNI